MSIVFNSVSHIYNPNTSLEFIGLDEVSFEISNGSFTAIIGHTGSGKSTLMQHFNALLKPTFGSIFIDNKYNINSKTSNKNLKTLRKDIGMVFQFSENQLFAETVLKDVMYGPLNFGFSKSEAEKKARKWLKNVGISEKYFDNSVFDLSGGQMRRVAIAGVLASEPKYLCLDEPSAGLDTNGQKEIMQLFKKYHDDGHTIILISHNMDEVIDYADSVMVFQNGKMIRKTDPKTLFLDRNWLHKHHLRQPKLFDFAAKLNDNGLKISKDPNTVSALVQQISEKLKKKDSNE